MMMLDGDLAKKEIKPWWFMTDERFAFIAAAIGALQYAEEPIDVLTVCDMLENPPGDRFPFDDAGPNSMRSFVSHLALSSTGDPVIGKLCYEIVLNTYLSVERWHLNSAD